MTSPRFSTAELQEHRESISKGGCGTPKKRSNLKKLKMGTHRTIARKKKKVTKPFDPLWRDVGKSSRAARVAAAAARGAGKGMTSAERSAAAKKGWETRRRKSGSVTQAKSVAQLGGRKQAVREAVESSRSKGGVRSRRRAAMRSSVAAQAARKKRGTASSPKKSALSAKDQNLPYEVKVRKLRTIATRAQAKADWLSGRKGKDGKQLPAEFVDRAEAAKYQAKAKAVADELLALAQEKGDPRVAHIGKPVGKKPAAKKGSR